jgi:hypothetical protein
MEPERRRQRWKVDQVWVIPALLLLLALVIGFHLADDFGMSVDEYANAEVGAAALDVYRGRPGAYLSQGDSLSHHGPAYFMALSVASRLLAAVVPGWVEADGRHLTNYLTFLAGSAALYALCRRWLSPGLAGVTTALFVAQPLLFGYAFVNQKDTPFMAVFAIAIVAGLAVGDRLTGRVPATKSPSDKHLGDLMSEEWKALPIWRRGLLLGYLGWVGLAILDQEVFAWTRGWLRASTVAAYDGRPAPVFPWLFAPVAAHSPEIPLEAYLSKLEANLSLASIPLMLAIWAGAALLLWASFPRTVRRWSERNARWCLPACAGALVGIAISIRPIGAFAGLLVSLFWILRLKRGAILPVLAGWGAAGIAGYLTWPYLWSDPLRSLWASLQLTATFPAHDMLYRGAMISSDALPWHFFPTLASIQLTEPVMPLVLLGLGVLLYGIRRGKLPWMDSLILCLWFGVPLFGLVVLGFGIYGNIRQLLFVLPPLFVLAGLTLDVIVRAVPVAWVRWAVAAILLLPGIVGIASMHPYEHAYFNLYAGGADGAWGEYQPSHWCTSMREATEYVNHNAPRHSLVLVDGPVEGVRAIAREDLVVEGVWSGIPDPDFLLVCTRTPDEMQSQEGMAEVYQVHRGQSVYAQVFESLRLEGLPADPSRMRRASATAALSHESGQAAVESSVSPAGLDIR